MTSRTSSEAIRSRRRRRRAPSARCVEVVPAQPVALSVACRRGRADVVGTKGTWSRAQRRLVAGIARGRVELRLLDAEEADALCEQPGVAAVGDDDLVLAAADGPQSRLTTPNSSSSCCTSRGQASAVGRVRDLDRVARQQRGGAVAREQRRRNACLKRSDPCQTRSGTNLPAARSPIRNASALSRKAVEVLDVELVEPAAGLDDALGDVARPADVLVVGRERPRRRSPVSMLLNPARVSRRPALGHEGAEEDARGERSERCQLGLEAARACG